VINELREQKVKATNKSASLHCSLDSDFFGLSSL